MVRGATSHARSTARAAERLVPFAAGLPIVSHGDRGGPRPRKGPRRTRLAIGFFGVCPPSHAILLMSRALYTIPVGVSGLSRSGIVCVPRLVLGWGVSVIGTGCAAVPVSRHSPTRTHGRIGFVTAHRRGWRVAVGVRVRTVSYVLRHPASHTKACKGAGGNRHVCVCGTSYTAYGDAGTGSERVQFCNV